MPYLFQSKPLVLGQAPPAASRIGRLRGHEVGFPIEAETMRKLSSMIFGQSGHEARLKDYFDFLNVFDYYPGPKGYKRDKFPDRIMQHKMKIRDKLGQFSNNEIVILLGQNVGRSWKRQYSVGIEKDQMFRLWTHPAWGLNFFHQPRVVMQIPHPSSPMETEVKGAASDALRRAMQFKDTYQLISEISDCLPVEWQPPVETNLDEIT